jgi:hypothetical protein
VQNLRKVTLTLLIAFIGGVSAVMADEKPGKLDDASRALVDSARMDLAQRLSIAPSAIELIGFDTVIWPDASMGCPQPGMVHAQVQRDGYRMEFEARGRRYWYHGGAGRAPFYCAHPVRNSNPPAGPPPDQRV